MIDDEAWAVGAHGTIIHFDGKLWTLFDSPTGNNLYSVSFSDARNGIAVGDFGTILSFNDGKLECCREWNSRRLFTVSTRKDDIWIGGGLNVLIFPL